jgi:hypothetical protein
MRYLIASIACLPVVASCVLAEEPEVMTRAELPRLELEGLAQGGTVSIGAVLAAHPVLTVDTTVGETPAQIYQKLVAAHEQDPDGSPFPWLQVTEDGQALCTDVAAFARSTDPGIPTVPAVSDLRATTSKSQEKVTLTWTLPSPAPDRIVVVRNHWRGYVRPGTSTSFEETNFDSSPVHTLRIAYTVVSEKLNPDGSVKLSNVAELKTENLQSMEDDVFKIVTTQNWVSTGALGHPYSVTIYKQAGTNPVFWSVDSGVLPEGLSLTTTNNVDAVISGTPTTVGTSDFVLKVTDATNATTAKALFITIEPLPLLGLELPPMD